MKKLVIGLVFLLFYVSFVSATDINECGVLDQEGETYELQNDIEIDENCFRIGSGVVLDCNGHSITGPNNERQNYGVYAEGSRITIRNCEITGFEEGIFFYVVEGEIIHNNLHGNDGLGISLRSLADSNTISENIISENHVGIYLDGVYSNTIVNNIISGNGEGIDLSWDSGSNTIVNNIISENSEGISLDLSDYNTIIDNHFENNWAGIDLMNGYLNIITDNIINENRVGIFLMDGESNIITNNIMNNNDYGIFLDGSSSNTITDNIVNNNNDNGIFLDNTNSNDITSNMFCYNDERDIRLNGGEDNEFLYNQCDDRPEDIECMPCDIEEHEIELRRGWNLISSYLVPYFTDIEAIFGPMARKGELLIVKDEEGRFYRPANDFNNIPRWVSTEAYYVKVTQNTELIIKGEEHTSLEIPLEQGWNYIAYPLTESLDMEYVIENILSPLIEENILDIMKNDDGEFYKPEYNYNGIEHLIPGEGYMIKVTEDSVIDFGE